jgi:Domain of unknown function (DUF4258)
MRWRNWLRRNLLWNKYSKEGILLHSMDCKKIMIGEHSFRRMFEREISPEDVLETVRNGEIIKE